MSVISPGQRQYSNVAVLVKRLLINISLVTTLTQRVDGQAVDWPTLGFSLVVTNKFSSPTTITHAGDGSQRIFVEEQKGRIFIIQSNAVLTQPFLNITNRVLTAGAEQGLLGLAFPSNFAVNPHFYVNYIRTNDGAVVISKFFLTADPNVADPSSEQVVLVIPKPFNNHNGGQIAFGPDGYLYIGVGDGGSENDPQNRSQNTGVLLGKMLRIDVEGGSVPYGIPTNNPFVGNTNYAPEIWALGLRNPWRFSFDRLTGDLYIGDVGQNIYEEIDFQPSGSPGGQNYGWRIMEGPTNHNVPAGFTNFQSLAAPVTWYSHFILPVDGAGAVTGGYVYHGPTEPRLDGVYFFGDFMAGWIWGLKRIGTNWQQYPLLQPSHAPPFTNMAISTFGEDDQGRLYLADYGRGLIQQVVDTHNAIAPVFSPPGGTINSNTVMITSATANASIHFTTNGINPTTLDPTVPSNGIIQVFPGLPYQARAFRPDLSPSDVAGAAYSFQVGTPMFSPPAGPIVSNSPVSLTTVTAGATIYYTTNGTVPTSNSTVYAGPIIISGGTTIRAIGVASGFANSLVANATYSAARVATPAFTPASGPITNGTPLTITCATPGSIILYTLDGSPPASNSAVYSGPIAINGGVTVEAVAQASNYVDSATQIAFYQLVQTAPPVFTPPAGPITNGTSISMSCATPGSTIYYTVDGNTPTTNSPVYSSPISITGGTTVSAYATADQHLDSVVTSVLYQLYTLGAPQFLPSQGPLTNGALISISSTNPNAQIYYTVDGTPPTTNSPVFNGAILFTNPITLQALAVADGYLPSTQTTFFGLLDSLSNVAVTTFAGSPAEGFADGVGTAARFRWPQGICMSPSGNLFVADTGNNCIREILPSGQVITYAGQGMVLNSQSPSATNAFFNGPVGVCLDAAGNLYVGDGGNCNRICKIGTDGSFSVYANVTVCGPGIGNFAAGLGQLVADPSGNLYSGYWARADEIMTNGSIAELAGTGCNCSGGWSVSVGLGLDSATNLYATTGITVWQIPPGGSVRSFAGGNSVFSDGPAALAGFTTLTGAMVDNLSNIFLADTVRIRKLDPSGRVITIAGTDAAGYADGPGTAAQFNGVYPWEFSTISHMGLCLDSAGNLYVSDIANNCIRKISFNTIARPILGAILSTNVLTLTWPGWASDFALESSGSLSPGAAWVPVTNGVTATQVGGGYVWSNQVAGTNKFFRLRRP